MKLAISATDRLTLLKSVVSRLGMVCLLTLSCSSLPASPLEIGQLNLGAAYDVYVTGTTAYVSNNEGIAILDIQDIEHPREVVTIQEDVGVGSVAGFSFSGDTLAAFGSRLALYAVDDPANPSMLASYTGRDFISGARIEGRYAYVSYLNGGLEVVDFSMQSNPMSVGYASGGGQVNDLAVLSEFVFLANSSAGLEVYDVSQPDAPTRIGVVAGTAGAWDSMWIRGFSTSGVICME